MDLGYNEGGVGLEVNAVETFKFDSCSEDILDGEGCKEITVVVAFRSYNTVRLHSNDPEDRVPIVKCARLQ